MWTKALLPEADAILWVATIGALQVPFGVLINGIATEDAAQIAAGTHVSQQDSK